MIWAKLGSGFTPATASTIVSHMPEKHPAVYILPRAAGSPAGWSASMPWAARAPLPKPSSRPARTIKHGHCQALRPQSGARRTNQTIHQKQTKACQLGHQHSASHSRPANPLTWTRCPAPCHRHMPCHRHIAHGAILLYRASHGTRAEHHVRPGSFLAAARAWPPASEQPLRACRASLPWPCRGNGVHPGASARQRVCHHDDFPR